MGVKFSPEEYFSQTFGRWGPQEIGARTLAITLTLKTSETQSKLCKAFKRYSQTQAQWQVRIWTNFKEISSNECGS